MRDLRKELKTYYDLWELEDATKNIMEFIENIFPEVISRAIAAEELLASHAPEGHNITNEQYQRLREDNAALREENDLQRDSIQQLSAQVAEQNTLYRGAIHSVEKIILDNTVSFTELQEHIDKYTTFTLKNNPGAEIRERLAKLEAVAEAVKSIDEWEDDGKDYDSVLLPQELYYLLMDALDALEGPTDE